MTMTPLELARRWGVSRQKIWNWINDGSLRAMNVAKNQHGLPHWRITEAEAERFERTRMSTGAASNAT